MSKTFLFDSKSVTDRASKRTCRQCNIKVNNVKLLKTKIVLMSKGV